MTEQEETDSNPVNKKFKKMLKSELVLMAESLGIDPARLNKVELREAIREADNEVIYPPETGWVPPVPESNKSGIIMSAQKKPTKKVISKEESDEDKVAIWSERNISSREFGKIERGFNFVTEERAERWVSKRGIRKATTGEVAQYYGVS